MNSDIYSGIYFDDEDEQLTDEEFEELIEFVEKRREKYLNKKRINQISKELSDQLFIEFLMLDEETRNQLKNMTNEVLFVEWIDPSDEAIKYFKHLDYNKNIVDNSYNYESFMSELNKNFTSVEMIGNTRDTRKIFKATI